jgi:hypothetical protein
MTIVVETATPYAPVSLAELPKLTTTARVAARRIQFTCGM